MLTWSDAVDAVGVFGFFLSIGILFWERWKRRVSLKISNVRLFIPEQTTTSSFLLNATLSNMSERCIAITSIALMTDSDHEISCDRERRIFFFGRKGDRTHEKAISPMPINFSPLESAEIWLYFQGSPKASNTPGASLREVFHPLQPRSQAAPSPTLEGVHIGNPPIPLLLRAYTPYKSVFLDALAEHRPYSDIASLYVREI